jgi:hypothetical protein
LKVADLDSDQSQRWMTNGGSHAADLPVLAFDELQREPASWNVFAETDWGIPRRDFWLWIDNRCPTRQSFTALHDRSFLERSECSRIRTSFHLRPIDSLMAVAWMEKALVEFRFIAE